jgi:PAS domain S-box-containing protein
MVQHDEEEDLRTVALRNAEAIRIARQRVEHELLATKDELERKTSELAAALDEAMKLRQFTRELVRAAAPADVAQMACRWARELMEADGATFVQREGDTVHCIAEDAVAPLWAGQRFPIDACISGWAMLNGQTAAIPDVYADARIPVAAYRPTFVQALLVVPVREAGSSDSDEGPPAAIGVYWARRHEASDNKTRLLEGMADAAAVALARARLHAEMQHARQQAEALAAIVHSSYDAIVSKTLDGVITAWNPAAERMFGWTAAEAIGRHITLIIPKERHADEADVLARLRRGERLEHFETVRQTKDGRKIDVSLTISPLADADGRIVGASSVARDITERREMDEARGRLAAIVDSSDDAILSKDLNGIITSWNKGAERVFGYTASEAVGRTITMLIPAERLDEETTILARIRRGERVEPFETIRVRKDGSRLDISLTVSPVIDAEGRILGASTIARDVTAQVSARKALEESREVLREADRRKDEFLATLSHELRTPLNAMLGWLRMLRSGTLDEATARRALEVVDRSVNHQGRLITDLLDISRIVAGKLTLERSAIDLSMIVANAVDATRPLAEAKALALTLHPAEGAVPVHGDAERLRQVITNLLSNAVKFTRSGGHVTVRVLRAGDHARITVSDTGKGITEDFLPYVFDRFRQADSTSARAQAGLGLGLAIVRHLVELHGGTVSAESGGQGKGATFTVELPVTTPSVDGVIEVADVDERADALLNSVNGVRVLIVDDDADTRELLTTIFVREGAKVTATASVREALAISRRLRPDVLLCDIAMPGEDGFVLIRQVRSWPASEGREIRAIALTAYARPEDRDRALSAGFQLHLSKPVEPQTLIEAVAQLARRAAA